MKTKKLTTPILIISALILGISTSIWAATGAWRSNTSCTASDDYSTAMGLATTASGYSSTAMGTYTTASGKHSTAIGYNTTASGGWGSTAMGYATTASGGWGSTAMGYHTTASGYYSTAMGIYTTASGNHQTVIGKYNVSTTSPAFIIGGGSDSDHKKNIFYVDWNGNVHNNGNFPISDIRLKTNIKTIENPLEKIMKLRGVRYEWKKEEKRTHGYKPEIGLIAQEVEKIVPELVSTDKTPDSKGRYLKSVAYEKSVALLIEGIKELKRENEKQNQEIQKLKAEIKELKK